MDASSFLLHHVLIMTSKPKSHVGLCDRCHLSHSIYVEEGDSSCSIFMRGHLQTGINTFLNKGVECTTSRASCVCACVSALATRALAGPVREKTSSQTADRDWH